MRFSQFCVIKDRMKCFSQLYKVTNVKCQVLPTLHNWPCICRDKHILKLHVGLNSSYHAYDAYNSVTGVFFFRIKGFWGRLNWKVNYQDL